MITQIHPKIQIGDLDACAHQSFTVHACKHPCFQDRYGSAKPPPKDDPEYLAIETPANLYLNMIDSPKPLFQMDMFSRFFHFARRHCDSTILIHCNLGESRAPSLGLLLLAFQEKEIPSISYDEARAEFEKLWFHHYKPGDGISTFLRQNWDELRSRYEHAYA